MTDTAPTPAEIEAMAHELEREHVSDIASEAATMLRSLARQAQPGSAVGDLRRLKDRLDSRLDAYLCEMKEGYDDSIVGFNQAWGIIRKAFDEALSASPAAPSQEGWQAIETAPKDGTWFLAYAARDSAPYRVSWGRNHRGELAWCTQFSSFVEGYLTLWHAVPLPPAPLSTEGGER
jgi:hypothetical protein